MARSSTRGAKVKRSIPGTLGMWCANCAAFNAEGRIDSGGRPFIGCSVCRLMCFGLTAQAIWSHKALSVAFANMNFRESIRMRAAEFSEKALAGAYIPGGVPVLSQPRPAAEGVVADGAAADLRADAEAAAGA